MILTLKIGHQFCLNFGEHRIGTFRSWLMLYIVFISNVFHAYNLRRFRWPSKLKSMELNWTIFLPLLKYRLWLHFYTINMNNKSDNSFELFSRRHSTRDAPTSGVDRNGDTVKRYSLSTGADATSTSRINGRNTDEFNTSSISVISGSRSTVTRTPSVKLKTKRKRSTSSEVTASDSSSKIHRQKGRSALTSSFLRRKQVEYAGTFHIFTLKRANCYIAYDMFIAITELDYDCLYFLQVLFSLSFWRQ